MYGAVRSTRQRVLNNRFHALWSHWANDDFAAVLFLQPQPFFERITIRFIDFKRKVGLFDPGGRFVYAQDRVFTRDLLHHHYDFHLNKTFLVLGSLYFVCLALVRARFAEKQFNAHRSQLQSSKNKVQRTNTKLLRRTIRRTVWRVMRHSFRQNQSCLTGRIQPALHVVHSERSQDRTRDLDWRS